MKLIRDIFTIKEIPLLSWSSLEPLNIKPKLTTFLYLIFGLILFGLGETILIAASQGVSPWTVLAQGISFHSNLSIGLSTFIVSAIVLIFWIPLKQKPGIGTIMNAILISIVLDYSYPYLPKPDQFFYQIIQCFFGVFLIGLGSGFYLIANLGAGPRDGLNIGLSNITKQPIFSIRTVLEFAAVILGWYLGGIVGIGTIIFAIFVGPFVSLGLVLVKFFFK
jgi:uncharacterized membrane protein YczE